MDGWIACDKPIGVSCVRIANIAKRMIGQKRIGHVGTLDPLATGIVTLALGEATKLIPYLKHPTKTYEFAIHWGEERDTDDAEGRVTQTSSVVPHEDAIQQATQHFVGPQQQIPPQYSAIHVNGVRAYHLVRKGQTCELPSRTVHIETLEWLGNNQFRVVCQAGTYVRSLARDMARFLGTVGHVAWLRRTDDSLFSTQHNHLWHGSKEENPYIYTPETLMKDFPHVELDEAQLLKFQQGMPLDDPTPKKDWVCVYHAEKLRGVAQWEEGQLKPHRFLWR